MEIYNYDHGGFYISSGVADESPLEPGIFLIPGMATAIRPPAVNDGELARWTGEKWEAVAAPLPTAEEPLTDEQIDAMRVAAYSHPVYGSDRLYAKALRLQINGDDNWKEVVDQANRAFGEIQERYPKT